MRFSKNEPTESGYYWFLDINLKEMEIIEVFKYMNRIDFYRFDTDDEPKDGLWGEKIEPPTYIEKG